MDFSKALVRLGIGSPKEKEPGYWDLLEAKEMDLKAAKNPETPIEVLAKLAKNRCEWIRCRVAKNSGATGNILRGLAFDEDRNVRACVARNHNIPPDVCRLLCNDPEDTIRTAVAKNPSTPEDVLFILARSDCLSASSVARNPAASKKLLHLLVTLDISTRFASEYNVSINRNTGPETLEILASSNWAHVRECVARHPNVPIDILMELLKDSNDDVRAAAAKSRHMTDEIVIEMIGLGLGSENQIARSIIKNPFISEEVRNMVQLISGDVR